MLQFYTAREARARREESAESRGVAEGSTSSKCLAASFDVRAQQGV
jgi:hypothetical protein